MKKVLFISLIFLMVISLLSGCGKQKPPAFALRNGNMEREEDLKWGSSGSWWLPDSRNMAFVEYTNDPSNPSNHCLKISRSIIVIPDDEEVGFIAVAQVITEGIPIGKKLKFTVQIKTEDLTISGEPTKCGAVIAIRCDTSLGGDAEQFATTEGRIPIIEAKDWTSYTVELNEKVQTGTKEVIVYLFFAPNTTGTIYFDNASLVVID